MGLSGLDDGVGRELGKEKKSGNKSTDLKERGVS